MHELELGWRRACGGELLAHAVFDRLDVVIGLSLELLDARESGRVEPAREAFDAVLVDGGRAARERGEAPDAASWRNQAASTRTRWPISAASLKSAREVGAFLGIATVERRQRVQAGVGHGGGGANDRMRMLPVSAKDRIEKDSLGEVRVAADALWGAQTQRALDNFRIGRARMPDGADPRHRAHQVGGRGDERRTRRAAGADSRRRSPLLRSRSPPAGTPTSFRSASCRPAPAPAPT